MAEERIMEAESISAEELVIIGAEDRPLSRRRFGYYRGAHGFYRGYGYGWDLDLEDMG